MKRILWVEIMEPLYSSPKRIPQLEKFLGEKVEEVGSVNFLLHDDITKKLSDSIIECNPDLIILGSCYKWTQEVIKTIAQKAMVPVIKGLLLVHSDLIWERDDITSVYYYYCLD